MPERVEARAPTRIDLAGGTIDIWPLYLLHDAPVTVNAAIDLYARASVEAAPDGVYEVVSRDRRASVRAESIDRLRSLTREAPDDLKRVLRLASHVLAAGRGGATGPIPPCHIMTDCAAPAGSGLGGSSALGIALAFALDRFVGRGLGSDRLLAMTRAIETQVLGIPTGEQDYHPAAVGGPLALHYTVEGTQVEKLAVDLEALRRRTVLVYTGLSRSSGISNWDMVKRHLDGERRVREALDEVNRAAHAMREAMLAADWQAVGAALSEEWEARKRLSPTVTNASIDRLIDAARGAGALAGKVCGAGGGGCVVLWTRDDRREAVRDKVSGLGVKVLDVHFVAEGVSLTVS